MTVDVFNYLPALSPFGSLADENKFRKELVLTNQEGTLFFATCYEYYIDLSTIEQEMFEKGLLNKYIYPDFEDTEKIEELNEIAEISKTRIPKGKYYLPFTMSLISLKSHKY